MDNHISQTTSTTTKIIPNHDAPLRVCSTCFFATSELIPDPRLRWDGPGTCKPRCTGCRCHASRPASNGFSTHLPDDWCYLWADKATHSQPLRHLVSDAVTKKEVV